MEKKVHMGIKPHKILLDSNGTAYIGDLRGAKRFSEKTDVKTIITVGGNDNWVAPEIRKSFKTRKFEGIEYSKIDVFSIGLVTLFMIDHQNFSGKSKLFNQEEKELQVYLKELEGRFSSSIDKEFFKILDGMLSFKVDKRISIADLNTWMVYML